MEHAGWQESGSGDPARRFGFREAELRSHPMPNREQLLERFSLFSVPTGGIGSWLSQNTHQDVFERLGRIGEDPLPIVQLNQCLVLAHEAPVSDGFFNYYWTSTPQGHPYSVKTLPGFSDDCIVDSNKIVSIDHLYWGLYRLYVDALLYFGNVRTAFRKLRDLSYAEIEHLFHHERFNTELIKKRGPALPMKPIAKDDRYLISEMACKSYGDGQVQQGDLLNTLISAYRAHAAAGNPRPKIKTLLSESIPQNAANRQQEFIFSADEVLEEYIDSESEIEQKLGRVVGRFAKARAYALDNTRLYLSMLSDLDIYVATSMRNRNDFRNMADTCERIFESDKLKELNLRYFDPTLSAAAGHEDKGLIECLMVRCAKMLIYCAGERESYGKDAEAAMALSLGKPVIFYCDHEQKSRFYRDVHPLGRLIEFETGVAVGAMVTDKVEDVIDIISRVFSNNMEYELSHPKPGYLRLIEKLTRSVVRVQTNDQLLTEAFWNHYHRDRQSRHRGVGSA